MFLVSSYEDDGIVRAKQGRLMKMKQSSRSEDCPRGTKEGPGLIRQVAGCCAASPKEERDPFSFPLPKGTSALRGASDELQTAPPCSPGGLKLRHPMQHRANILFRYAPILALPPFSMLVAGISRPSRRDLDQSISPERAVRPCTFRADPL